MQKWEYRSMAIRTSDVPNRLAEVGAEGWEAVSFIAWGDLLLYFVLKRLVR